MNTVEKLVLRWSPLLPRLGYSSTHRENSTLENENLWEDDQGCGQEQSPVIEEYNLV